MKRTLVSLVSDQTLPNILFIKEMIHKKGMNFHRYLFITTKQMEEKEKTKHIENACQNEIKYSQVKRIVVKEESSEDVIDNLAKQKFSDNEEFIVNLTCGTKMMSIGVFQFFLNQNSTMYYVPIGENVIRKLKKNEQEKEENTDISYRLSVKEYLTAYGIQSSCANMNVTFQNYQLSTRILDLFIHNSINLDALNVLRGRRNDKSGVSINDIGGLDAVLNAIGYPKQTNGRLTQKDVQYLTGGWFEELVYYTIKEALNLPDDHIGQNINIMRRDVKNEIDVIFTYNNAISIVECKTGMVDIQVKHKIIQGMLPYINQIKSKKPKEITLEDITNIVNHYHSIDTQSIFTIKSIANETIYKASAIRKDFGLTVKSYICTLDRNLRDETGKFKDYFYNRAKNEGVVIIDWQYFQEPYNLIDNFKKLIK